MRSRRPIAPCLDCGSLSRGTRCRRCTQRRSRKRLANGTGRVLKCGHYCGACFGQCWRVEGTVCACGLLRGPDVYQVQLPPQVSNMARALDRAWVA